jgi:galactitol-specific phosphotransferase system IIC component
VAGTLLFWRYGRTAALTAGLISGTRTITLAWVVLGDKVLPLADLFLATSMIAKYTAPGLTKWLLTRIIASGDDAAPSLQAQPVAATPADR